jgi:hypothetical protein
MAANDPDFEKKAVDIIGLYLNPPAHAAVFSVDEKTASQALDRKDPVLPQSGASNGTALSTFVKARCRCTPPSTPRQVRCSATAARRTSAEFGAFLAEIVISPRQRDPCDRRRPLSAQEQPGHGLPGGAPRSSLALHSDLLFVAGSGRAVVQQDRARCHRTGCLHSRL